MRTPLADLTVNDLESAYNGKSGCACGCRGTHSTPDERPRSVAYTLAHIKRHADEVSEGANNFAYDNGTRLYIVYPKPEALA